MISIKRKRTYIFSLFAFLLLASFSSQAQLKLVPIPHKPAVAQKKTVGSTLRQLARADTLRNLPFWDDFSFSGGIPDDSLWENSEHVNITRGIAILPPSVGVATFDGTDMDGRPHSQDANVASQKDELTSKPIALGPGSILPEEEGSIFLSFYWQQQGRGETPEKGDSLRLFFLDKDTIYHQIWPSARNKVAPGTDPSKFHHVIINLKEEGERLNTNFLHNGFRFKFASTNRLSGMFDLWHLDYVYLGKGDSNNRFYAEDLAISQIQPSLFKTYTALPIEQFYAAPEKYIEAFDLDGKAATLFNITAFNFNDPAKKDKVINYHLSLKANQESVYEKEKTGTFNTEQKGQTYYFKNDTILGLPNIFETLKENDSLYITTVVSISNDNIIKTPYYALNNVDTIQNVLHNYFAYDDGTAEGAAAFIGGFGTRLAVEYTLEVQDTLTHLDIYLPFYNHSIGGQYANLSVWKEIAMEGGTGKDSLIRSQSVALRNSSGLNKLESYELANPLVLSPGTYYFGLEKETSKIIALGIDRNTDSKEKVFISTNQESWEAGLEDSGSLMLRPRFTRGVDPLTLGIGKNFQEPETTFPVNIYPNPSDGFFVVESEARSIQIYSIQGQLIRAIEQARGTYRQEIDLRGIQEGLYLVKLTYKDGIITKKLLIKN